MASREMGLFDKLKKKKQAEPAQQPVAPPGLPSSQQPGRFPTARGVQPGPVVTPPTAFFGSGPQQVPPQAQVPVQQAPVPQQQPMQPPTQPPAQQPKPNIPSFPTLSPVSKPASPTPKPAQPTPGQHQADAVAVKAAVQKPVTQPAQAKPIFGVPAAPEASHLFSDLKKPTAGAGLLGEAAPPTESSLGLVPLEEAKEVGAVTEQPEAPPRSKGRDKMRGDKPLFVAVQHYASVLDSLKDIRKSIKEFEKHTYSIDHLQKKTLSLSKGWQGHLDDIHNKLTYIDHVLFER